jgi:para-aminobenzoate synthetase/4-amino-4-deoxychorismate lyase
VSALIETVRVHKGAAPLWPLHLERLQRSAAELGITLPHLSPPAGGDDRIVRYEVTSEGVQLSERELPHTESLSLATSPAEHRGYPHKTTERGWLEAARLSVHPLGADDALLLRAGVLVEGTIWAIGWWDDETLCFPPLALGGLPSVGRARLAETVRGKIREVEIRRDELAWRALVAVNAVRGLVPVHSLDGEPVPGNFRTTAIAGRFWNRRPG